MIWDTFDDARKASLSADEEAHEIKAIDMGIARYRELRTQSNPAAQTP